MKNRQQYIAISQLWTKAYFNCMEAQAFNPPIFAEVVESFYDSLLDLGPDKLQIRTIVETYYNTELMPFYDLLVSEEINNNWANTRGNLDRIKRDKKKLLMPLLYKKIIQTIQDSGIGWELSKGGDGYDISANPSE